ncbi:hypothetical protein [Streptomyces sp. NPDC002324]
MSEHRTRVWAGIDAGDAHRWAVRTVNRMSGACSVGRVAATAVAAAGAQRTTLSGEQVTAAGIVAEPARQILTLDQRLTTIEDQIRDTCHGHP